MRLLGVILAVGLLVGLGALAMTRASEPGTKIVDKMPIEVGPGGEVTPAAESGSTAEGGALDAAGTVACATTAQTLRAAEESYRLLFGRYADLPTLVESDTIRPPAEDLYRIESSDGFTTFRLVGQHGCP